MRRCGAHPTGGDARVGEARGRGCAQRAGRLGGIEIVDVLVRGERLPIGVQRYAVIVVVVGGRRRLRRPSKASLEAAEQTAGDRSRWRVRRVRKVRRRRWWGNRRSRRRRKRRRGRRGGIGWRRDELRLLLVRVYLRRVGGRVNVLPLRRRQWCQLLLVLPRLLLLMLCLRLLLLLLLPRLLLLIQELLLDLLLLLLSQRRLLLRLLLQRVVHLQRLGVCCSQLAHSAFHLLKGRRERRIVASSTTSSRQILSVVAVGFEGGKVAVVMRRMLWHARGRRADMRRRVGLMLEGWRGRAR